MEIPESRLIKSEISLREMQLTDDVKMARKSLVRWLALAFGLISPKESRQSILPLFEAILYYHLKEKRDPNYEDITEYLKREGIEINEKTIRYHLTQMRKAGILENSRGTYRLSWFSGGDMNNSLDDYYTKRCSAAVATIKEALDALRKLQETADGGQVNSQ